MSRGPSPQRLRALGQQAGREAAKVTHHDGRTESRPRVRISDPDFKSVREPLPPMWPLVGAWVVDFALIVFNVWWMLSISVIGGALGLATLAFFMHRQRRNYRRTIKERAQVRERNFWRVIDRQINTELPTPSQPLTELEAQLFGDVREQLAKVVDESRKGTPPKRLLRPCEPLTYEPHNPYEPHNRLLRLCGLRT